MEFLTENPVLLFLGYIALLSLITFAAYGIDKYKAMRGAWRISEKALILLSLFGGAVGGLAAMKLFRHKTKHTGFWIANIFGLIIHSFLALLVAKYI